MNTKKVFFLLCSIFLGINLLSSCNDEDSTSNSPHFLPYSYFKGTINGEKTSLENTVHELPIHKTTCRLLKVGEPTTIKGSIIGITYTYAQGVAEGIAIMLHKPTNGIRYTTNPVDFECNYDGVQIRSIKEKEYHYVPKKENSFQIEITNITYLNDEVLDIIEGKINGVLYRTDNPQDSIVVNGVFGAR